MPPMITITFAHLRGQPERYSQVRLWGSIGFILAVVVLGRLFQWLITPHAERLYEFMAHRGILLRLFTHNSSVRFGLPANEADWQQRAITVSVLQMADAPVEIEARLAALPRNSTPLP